MEKKKEISKLNSNLALNKGNEILVIVNICQAFI